MRYSHRNRQRRAIKETRPIPPALYSLSPGLASSFLSITKKTVRGVPSLTPSIESTPEAILPDRRPDRLVVVDSLAGSSPGSLEDSLEDIAAGGGVFPLGFLKLQSRLNPPGQGIPEKKIRWRKTLLKRN